MKIAMLMNNIGRYTGGRVHFWSMAYALTHLGHDVTVYTDRPAGFIMNDLRGRKAPKVHAEEMRDVEADLYMGIPIEGNRKAAELAERHNAKALCCIFDPKPALDRAGIKWEEYPDEMPYLKSDRVTILSLALANNADIVSWLGVDPGKIEVVYPCVNDLALKKADKAKETNAVIFVSRLVKHKHLDHLVDVLRPLGTGLMVVSSDRDPELGDSISWHVRVGDKAKFGLIKSSLAVCVPTTHEGFGMWAIEAWACGKPVVCYGLPSIREVDAGGTYFAKLGDKWDLQRQLIRCLSERREVKPDKRFYFGRMVERLKEVVAGL